MKPNTFSFGNKSKIISIISSHVFLFSRFTDETGASIEKPMATLVYIHGESYEWNSGNLYDGTVLAAHSNIIVVTINFRLGVLGEFNLVIFISPSICCDDLCARGLQDEFIYKTEKTSVSAMFSMDRKREIFYEAKFIAHTQIILKNKTIFVEHSLAVF